MPEPSPLPEFLAFAQDLADLARGIALQHFRSLGAVDTKDDRTPVTEADRRIEDRLRAAIAARFPAHGVLGEEQGPTRPEAEWLWVLDPIDGTKAFASGNPLFGTLIGLMRGGRPVLGVMEAPALGERWAAADGLGATHQGRPIRARAGRGLADAVLYCTTPEACAGTGFDALRGRVRWTSYGADCIAYGLLAMGCADFVVDRGLKVHDWCALVPILREAGAVLVDWDGGELRLDADGAVVAAADRQLLGAALEVLGGRGGCQG
jgi:histidinol phosphatase-like enzyme (inositol monophosphatase family)